MRSPPEDADYEVPPWMMTAARSFGVSEVRARWKIIQLRRRLRLGREALGLSRGQRRVMGHRLGDAPVVTLGLLVLMLVIYGRMLLARPGQGYLSWDSEALITFGAYWPPAIEHGQWWRLGTPIFLHIGLLHLGFNLTALTQIGPTVEHLFGRGRALFLFLATGVIANLACVVWGLFAVSAGASGALMGMAGLAAGWGQRTGTSIGRDARDQMLRWFVYTMVYGYFLHANNVAHAAGFVAGVLFGYAFRPERLAETRRSGASRTLGVVGLVGTLGCVGLCLLPPAPAGALERRATAPEERRGDAGALAACAELAVGRRQSAAVLLGYDVDDAALDAFCAEAATWRERERARTRGEAP